MADVRIIATMDEMKVLRAARRMGDNLRKELDKSSRKSSSSAQKHSKEWGAANEKAFGASAIAKITSYVAGIASIAAAANLAKSALDGVNRASEEAAQKGRAAEVGYSQLVQLGMGDEERVRSYIGMAKEIYLKGGARSQEEAAQIIFSLVSAGAEEERGLFARMFPMVQDPGQMAAAAGGLRTALGAKTAGSLRDILSMAMKASAGAPAKAEALLGAAGKAGVSLRGVGGNVEELMASTMIMAKAMTSAEEGGTAIKSFLAALQRQGIEGTGLLGGVEEITAMQTYRGGLKAKTRKEIVKMLPRKALAAYDVLSRELPFAREMTAEIRGAREEGLIEKIITSGEAIPEMVISRKRRMAAAEKELGLTGEGMKRNITDAIIDRLTARYRARGGGPMATWFTEKMMRTHRYFVGDESFIEFVGKTPVGAGPIPAGGSASAEGQMVRQTQVLENIERKLPGRVDQGEPKDK